MRYTRERWREATKAGAVAGLLGALGIALAITLTLGLGAIFHWSRTEKAIVWVVCALAVVAFVLTVSISRVTRQRRRFDRSDTDGPGATNGR